MFPEINNKVRHFDLLVGWLVDGEIAYFLQLVIAVLWFVFIVDLKAVHGHCKFSNNG